MLAIVKRNAPAPVIIAAVAVAEETVKPHVPAAAVRHVSLPAMENATMPVATLVITVARKIAIILAMGIATRAAVMVVITVVAEPARVLAKGHVEQIVPTAVLASV